MTAHKRLCRARGGSHVPAQPATKCPGNLRGALNPRTCSPIIDSDGLGWWTDDVSRAELLGADDLESLTDFAGISITEKWELDLSSEGAHNKSDRCLSSCESL
jgi:hypothetical protein